MVEATSLLRSTLLLNRVSQVMAPRHTFIAVVAVTLVGQFCSLAYEVVVARQFGTGFHADALALTLIMVFALANEITMWVSALFIPHYTEAKTKSGLSTAANLFRGMLTVLLVGTGALVVLVLVGTPGLLSLLAPTLAARGFGFDLLRLFTPLLVLLPLSALLAGALQAHGRFVAAAMRQLFWYGAAVVALVVFGLSIGPPAVPIAMTTGLALFCALLAVHFRATMGSPRGGEPTSSRLRRLAKPLLPLTFQSLASFLNVSLERAIAARLPAGSLAALTYAFRLLNFPINLFLLNATSMLFPALSIHAARAETTELETLLRQSLRLAVLFAVPIAGLTIALAEPVIRVLLERGAFTTESTHATSTALTYYAPGLIGMAGVHVVVRAYQALQEINRMVWIGIAVIALNIVLMPTLTALIGFRGLPVASSINWLMLFAVLLVGIRHQLPALGVATILASASRAILAGAVATACVWSLRGLGPSGALPELLTGAVMGTAVYGFVLFWLSRDDAQLALGFVAPILARRSLGRP